MGVGVQTVVGAVPSKRSRPAESRSCARRGLTALTVVVLVFGLASSWSGSDALAGSANNLYLIAGSGGVPSPPGSTGTASSSVGFASPGGVATDAVGNVLVADTSNGEVDLVVRASTASYRVTGGANPVTGDTYILAGGGTLSPSKTGTPATTVSGLLPSAVAHDDSGNVLIADTANSEIDVVAESASNPGYVISGSWIVGDLYVIAGGGLASPTVGGGVATAAALNGPLGIAVDGAGDLVIADTSDNEVELLSRSGTGSRVAGDLYVIAGGGTGGAPTGSGVVATNAQLNQPDSVAVDAEGNIAVADLAHNAVDILASSATDPGYGVGSSWSIGSMYRVLGGGGSVATTAGVASTTSKLNAPHGVAFDAGGDLIVGEAIHSTVDVLALASDNPGYALASSVAWTRGDFYVIGGTGLSNVSASGTIADQSVLYAPYGVATLPDGSLVFVDQSSKMVDRLVLSPSMPRSLGATASDATVTLSWTAPASNGGSAVSDYFVYVYDHGQTLPIATDDLGGTATSHTISNLSNGVTYDFSVVAESAIGTSVASVKVSSTPVASAALPTTTTTTTTTTTPAVTTTTIARTQQTPAATPVTVAATPVPTTQAIAPVVIPAPATIHSQVSLLGSPVAMASRGLSFAIRCSTKLCRGSLTVTARHLVRLHGGSGSISVFEESVVARVTYRDSSTRVRVIRVPLTSYGREMLKALSRNGASVVATATARGGRATKRRFRMYSYKRRVKSS